MITIIRVDLVPAKAVNCIGNTPGSLPSRPWSQCLIIEMPVILPLGHQHLVRVTHGCEIPQISKYYTTRMWAMLPGSKSVLENLDVVLLKGFLVTLLSPQ